MILSITFLSLAVICYSISQLQQFGKLKWAKQTLGSKTPTFWEVDSWMRKYKITKTEFGPHLVEAPDTWYYRFFKISYKERFPLSATALVMFTDGYHLMQTFFKLFIALSLGGLTWYSLLYWSVFTVVMSGSFKWLSK